MAINHPFIKYSMMPKHVPLVFVISNLKEMELYREYYLKIPIYFPDDKKKKLYEMLFPRYKFVNAYFCYPVKERKEIGDTNILVQAEKLDKGNLIIHRIAKFNS